MTELWGDGGVVRKRGVPSDLADRAKDMNRNQLRAHYRVSGARIGSWLEAAGVEVSYLRPPHNRRPIPDNFAAIAQTMTKTALGRYFAAIPTTIDRWLRETETTALKYTQRSNHGVTSSRMGKVMPIFHGKQSASNYDIAADTLRRERWIVYACNEKGLANITGKFWRCGNLVLTPDELLARAARYDRAAA